ncbi:MAG TPA: biotin/lipoyl-binding protein, partial [Chloroflexota bacterium]|nr:biotin/lipoyl-binding protein [Chloroflexota bacterium]
MLTLIRRLAASKPLVFSIIAILILAALVPVGAAFLVKPEAVTAQQRPTGGGLVVRTVPVGIGPISTVLGYAGAIQSTRQVNVAPRTQGMLQDVPVDVGSVVHRGDTLAVLDPGALPSQLLQAQAGLLSAKAKLTQIEVGARPEDIEAAEAQLHAAQLRLVALQQGRP